MKTYNGELFAMDTYITYSVVSDDEGLAKQGLDAIEKAFIEIDEMTNRFSADSQIFAVNAAAGREPVKVDEHLFSMVQTALTWSDKTDGAFNLLIGSVMNLWGFERENPEVPTREAIEKALLHTDYTKIVLDEDASTIFLPEEGMIMDAGGVAKGYATDFAVLKLKELGIENALINAGGNVYTMGKKEDGSVWRVGIQDPRDSQGLSGILQVSDKALVSSGDYQRYFEKDGVRYHHILDPKTGFPARLCTGTTIVMDSATIADILSTTTFVEGPEKGMALMDSLPEVDGAMFIDADGTIYTTESMQKYLSEE